MATPTMRAVVLDAPSPASALRIRELPVPTARPGWALIAVKAFGLNQSELHSRLGLAEGMTWPRVLGTEAVGVIAACPGGEFASTGRHAGGRNGPGLRRRLCRVHVPASEPSGAIHQRPGLADCRGPSL
jgi:NADPH:quinone reductase